MKRGRQLAKLVLSVTETNQLTEWTRRHKTSQALAFTRRWPISVRCNSSSAGSTVRKSELLDGLGYGMR